MKTILVVEDDENLAVLLGRVLPSWFGRTVVVGSVEAGETALRSAVFDVVLTDFQLPDGSGADLLYLAAELRPDARRVLWSGKLGAIESPHCAHLVLSKPIDLKSLRYALQGSTDGE